MSKIARAFRRRAHDFEDVISQVHGDMWSAPSPCEDWDARGVVRHVVTTMGESLARLDRSLSPAPTVDEDPMAAFRAARKDIEAVLDDPELASTPTRSRAGELPAEEMIDLLVSRDIVIHGWDLARAARLNARMNLIDVRALFPQAAKMPPEMREPGAFGPGVVIYGPEVAVPPGAPAQDRLIGMLGRDPAWTPPGGT